METHWILVADAAKARIFRTDNVLLDDLEEHLDLVHPASRLKDEQLVTDDRGRTHGGPAGPQGAMSHKVTQHDIERHRFSDELAAILDKGLREKAYERLVVAAPPQMLGELRKSFSSTVERAVVASVAHDYASMPIHKLGEALRKNINK